MSATLVQQSARPVETLPLWGKYHARPVAFLTQHAKERVVNPVLEEGLGCRVELVRGFDTDTLGTFTREIPRAGTQLEAARAKAREAMRLSGHSIGLASEGSFGPDPMIGFFPWNVEMLIWIDDERELEVVGVASSRNTNHAQHSSADWSEIESFAFQSGFPWHHMILRPNDDADSRMRKGIDESDALRAAFDWACQLSDKGVVFIETDMRAHANPKRMTVIAEAAQDLVQKLRSLCPQCELPGFARAKPVPGIPCEVCRRPTDTPIAWEYSCLKCSCREIRPLEGIPDFISPAQCAYCNP